MLVLWKLPEPKHNDAQTDEEQREKAPKLSRVDFLGAFTLVGTILTGLLSLDIGAKGAPFSVVACLLSSFIVFLAAFINVEKYYAQEPILSLNLVCKRGVLTSYLIIAFQAAGQFGVSQLLLCLDIDIFH